MVHVGNNFYYAIEKQLSTFLLFFRPSLPKNVSIVEKIRDIVSGK